LLEFLWVKNQFFCFSFIISAINLVNQKGDVKMSLGMFDVTMFLGMSGVAAIDENTKIIQANIRTQPPTWAVLERRLLDTIDGAVPVFLNKYIRPGGTLIWRAPCVLLDGADDMYEGFFNWPLYHALGGSDEILDMAIQEYNALTRQVTYDYHCATKEFLHRLDWFHLSETYIYFYYFGLVVPTNHEMVERAKQFAGFYMNEDEESKNFDPKHKIIRSPYNGSTGPVFHADRGCADYQLRNNMATLGPGFELDSEWAKDWEKVRAKFDEVVMRGDTPMNMAVVVLVTNAYLYTGDEKYKQWVVEYVDAWMERTRQNGGILPDNIGLSGKIGEYRNGEWWGGNYGWTSTFSLHMILGALTVAVECAQLLTGDTRYLDLLRSQFDMLLSHAVIEDGRLLVPYKHTSEGWVDFRPLFPRDCVHLWAASMADEDWRRLEKLRKGSGGDWTEVTEIGPRSVHEEPWVCFLAGDNPDYPEKVLSANYRVVLKRMELVLRDPDENLAQFIESQAHPENHWQVRNPVITEGLVQLTTGAPQTIYNGGLAQGRVRYFDIARQRPGLPKDIAALVSKLYADGLVLELVNLSVLETRDVIVQAGCYGEHEFTTVHYQTRKETEGQEELLDESVEVNQKFFCVRLLPGSEIRMNIKMRRYVNKPGYVFPWHGTVASG